jgi:hypothetical protein
VIPLSGEALDHRQHFISFNSSKTRKGRSAVGYTGAIHQASGELPFFASFQVHFQEPHFQEPRHRCLRIND